MISNNVICRNWQNGRCRWGSRCRYSHNGNHVEVEACYDYQKGRCSRGYNCKFSHQGGSQQSSKVCQDFLLGQCHSKPCCFSHGDKYVDSFLGSVITAQTERPKVCSDWQKGTCNGGQSCHLLHEGDKDSPWVIAKTAQGPNPASDPDNEAELNRRSDQQHHKNEETNPNPSMNDENISLNSEVLALSNLTIQSSVVHKAVQPSLDGSVYIQLLLRFINDVRIDINYSLVTSMLDYLTKSVAFRSKAC